MIPLPSSQRERLKRSNPHRPCPICGGTGCGQSGTLTLCWRVESEHQAKSGAWIHGEARPYQQVFTRRVAPPLAPIERRHAVFSTLLDCLTLSGPHADHLAEVRGLDDDTITRNQFATVPTRDEAAELVQGLAAQHDLSNVPGFYLSETGWRLRFAGMRGFYIPLRDVHGRIEALQIRRDGDDPKFRYCLVSTPHDEFPRGASSGAPLHFAGYPTEKLIITEGGLKAIICAQILGCCVIGLVAAGTFGGSIGWRLRRDLPDLRDVAIAFDADSATNPKVAQHLKRLQEALSIAGYAPSLLTWPAEQGKGLDDFLLNGGLDG
jgi:DNA primase